MNKYQKGQIIYINGKIQTEELTIDKIGSKYAYFINSRYRLVLERNVVEVEKYTYKNIFQTQEAAEKYIQEQITQIFN